MKWKDVPMPPAVRNLPRDKRGFPVPWVSEWEPGEASVELLRWEHPGIHIQMPYAHCSDEIGVGEPNLGALCPKRQIKGMLERLCDVCGEFIPAGPIYFLGAGFIGDDGTTGFRECGLHYECALYSAQVCPGLITKGDEPIVHEALAYHLQPEVMQRDSRAPDVTNTIFDSFQDPNLHMLSRIEPIVLLGVYAVPINPTKTPVPEWVRQQLKEKCA